MVEDVHRTRERRTGPERGTMVLSKVKCLLQKSEA